MESNRATTNWRRKGAILFHLHKGSTYGDYERDKLVLTRFICV